LTPSIGTMNWLNPQGQQLAQSKAQDIRNALTAMRKIASNHDATSSPLDVPSDAVTHLASLRDLPIPELYVMDSYIFSVFNQNTGGTDNIVTCWAESIVASATSSKRSRLTIWRACDTGPIMAIPFHFTITPGNSRQLC
jgi:hypothetical protein